MNICLDLICDEALLLSAAGKRFANQGHSITAITMGRRWSGARLDSFQCVSLTDQFSDTNYKINEELMRIEKVYGYYIPSSFIAADRFLSELPRDYAIKVLVHTFRILELLLLSNQIDIMLSTGVAYLYNLVALAICDKHSIPHVSFYHTRQERAAFTFSTSKGANWDEVTANYLQLNGGDKPSESEICFACSRIESFREQFDRPAYMNTARQSHSFKLIFFTEFMQRLRCWYVDGWGKEANDYVTKHPLWYAVRDSKKIVQVKAFNLVVNYIFDKPIYTEKFFLFPLHLQPEASTLVLSPHYTNQLEVIRSIAREMPVDQLLYVKEHPSAYGRHNASFYKAIKSISNVRLIGPREDTKNLLRLTSGVIVLSGTMGWEGFLLAKPVFVLGNVFYDSFSGVNTPRDYSELGFLIRHIETCEVASESSIINALIAIYRAQHIGLFDVHKMDTADTVLSDDNIQKFVDGVESIVYKLTEIGSKNPQAIRDGKI